MEARYIRLNCKNCGKKPKSSSSLGMFFTEIKTINSKIFLTAICSNLTCKELRVFPIDELAANCGRIIHCGSNNRHKIIITTKQIIVRCGRCNDKKFYFEKREVKYGST